MNTKYKPGNKLVSKLTGLIYIVKSITSKALYLSRLDDHKLIRWDLNFVDGDLINVSEMLS